MGEGLSSSDTVFDPSIMLNKMAISKILFDMFGEIFFYLLPITRETDAHIQTTVSGYDIKNKRNACSLPLQYVFLLLKNFIYLSSG